MELNGTSCPANNYYRVIANQYPYIVRCGVDLAGGDLAQVYSSTFDGCIEACSRNAACVDVTYIPGNKRCFLKNAFRPEKPNSAAWSAVIESAYLGRKIDCENDPGEYSFRTYEESSGKLWGIFCYEDAPGNDTVHSTAETMEACLAFCDRTEGCTAAAYRKGVCYLKNDYPDLVDRTGEAITYAEYGGTTTKLTSTITTTTTTTMTPSPTPGITCNKDNGKTFRDQNDKSYRITCGYDSANNDIAQFRTYTIEACLRLCDFTASCVGAAYRKGICYLKNKLVTPNARGGVTLAEYLSSSASTTTTSNPTSIATPTPISLANCKKYKPVSVIIWDKSFGPEIEQFTFRVPLPSGVALSIYNQSSSVLQIALQGVVGLKLGVGTVYSPLDAPVQIVPSKIYPKPLPDLTIAPLWSELIYFDESEDYLSYSFNCPILTITWNAAASGDMTSRNLFSLIQNLTTPNVVLFNYTSTFYTEIQPNTGIGVAFNRTVGADFPHTTEEPGYHKAVLCDTRFFPGSCQQTTFGAPF